MDNLTNNHKHLFEKLVLRIPTHKPMEKRKKNHGISKNILSEVCLCVIFLHTCCYDLFNSVEISKANPCPPAVIFIDSDIKQRSCPLVTSDFSSSFKQVEDVCGFPEEVVYVGLGNKRK